MNNKLQRKVINLRLVVPAIRRMPRWGQRGVSPHRLLPGGIMAKKPHNHPRKGI